MSESCLIDLSRNKLSFKEQEHLASELIKDAVNKHYGVHFNAIGYAPNIVKNNKIKFYYYISESFLYINSNFFDFSDMWYIDEKNDIKRNIIKKFSILINQIEYLIKENINLIDIYFTEGSDTEEQNDFKEIFFQGDNILNDIINYMINNNAQYQTEFQPLIIHINK